MKFPRSSYAAKPGTEVWEYQADFFMIAMVRVTDAYVALINEVKPIYDEALKLSLSDPENRGLAMTYWHWLEANVDNHAKLICLKESLETWGKKFHINEPWILGMALTTLFPVRERSEPPGRSLYVVGPALPEMPAELSRFRFSARGWEPGHETEDAFDKRIRAAFEKSLARYKERATAHAQQEKWIPVPEKRTSSRHLEWLVKFQMLDFSYKNIADEHTKESGEFITDDAVRKAIVRIAQLIRLTLRKA